MERIRKPYALLPVAVRHICKPHNANAQSKACKRAFHPVPQQPDDPNAENKIIYRELGVGKVLLCAKFYHGINFLKVFNFIFKSLFMCDL